MQETITFFPPDQGRACDGCTQCCTWLSGQAHGVEFGNGVSCSFLKGNGCGIYDTRPNVCRSFQCLWKTDLNLPEWLKPSLVNVILSTKVLGNFKYIEVVYAGTPDIRIFEWFKEQANLEHNFLIWHSKEAISNNADFKKFILAMNTTYEEN